MAKNHQQRFGNSESSDAAAYAAGMSGAAAADANFNAQAVGDTFEQAVPVITENVAGGGGYFAEAFHTGSFNVNAAHAGSYETADRLGSTEFASADIGLSSGEHYQVKYYESASDTYRASSEMLDDGGAKYGDTTVVVPADQLSEIEVMHQQAIADAYAAGDEALAHELESIDFADRMTAPDGTQSTPLDYADARQGAENMRHDILPKWAGEELNLGFEVAEGAFMAAGISMAMNFGADFLGSAADVVRGKVSLADAQQNMVEALRQPAARKMMVQGALRGSGAAAVAAFDVLDPLGAALVVNVLVDAMSLIQQINRGQIPASEFGSRLMNVVKDRSMYAGITAASVWAMGPVGLLVPMVIRRMAKDQQFQRQALENWRDVSEIMQDEMRERARAAATMDEVNSHYRRAEANADANQARSEELEERFKRIAGLLGKPQDNKGSEGVPA